MRDLSDAMLRCPECGHDLRTITYAEYQNPIANIDRSKPIDQCKNCLCIILMCEPERRGRDVIDGKFAGAACYPWPPEMRVTHFSRAIEQKRRMEAIRRFVDAVVGDDAATSPEIAALATGLRNRLVGTVLQAAVAGAMNGAENRLALAMRVVTLMRNAPDVPDPPPCFRARDSVPDMVRQILILAKSIVAVETAQRKDFT